MMSELAAYWQGLFTGAGLIIAIGAQNAYVLTLGIRQNHALAAAALCALIDVALISAGVLGLGALIKQNAVLQNVSALGGAAFLLWFGFRSLVEARKNHSMQAAEGTKDSLRKVLGTTLAISLLNPHVYLDTVVMLGAISSTYPGNGNISFGAGAVTASIIWFFSLSYAGHLLAPLFTRPGTWKVLHILVCIMVWLVAASLLLSVFRQ